MSYDDFDTEGFATGGERPPITGGQWSNARIANAFDVPAHLVGEPPPDPFYPSEFVRMLTRVHLPHLWDHDPGRTVPLVDRRGAVPVRVGDGVVVDDGYGHAVFSGTVDRPIFDHPSDHGHFSIRPTTTKESTKMQTKVTINAVSVTDDLPPSITIEIDHEGPSVEHLERVIAKAADAGREVLGGMGIAPYESVTIEVAKPDPMDVAIARDRELVGIPSDDDLAAENRAKEAPDAGATTNRAMYNAIASVAPNLVDVAKELADGAEGDEGSEGFRERLGVLSRTLTGAADTLEQSRLPF